MLMNGTKIEVETWEPEDAASIYHNMREKERKEEEEKKKEKESEDLSGKYYQLQCSQWKIFSILTNFNRLIVKFFL